MRGRRLGPARSATEPDAAPDASLDPDNVPPRSRLFLVVPKNADGQAIEARAPACSGCQRGRSWPILGPSTASVTQQAWLPAPACLAARAGSGRAHSGRAGPGGHRSARPLHSSAALRKGPGESARWRTLRSSPRARAWRRRTWPPSRTCSTARPTSSPPRASCSASTPRRAPRCVRWRPSTRPARCRPPRRSRPARPRRPGGRSGRPGAARCALWRPAQGGRCWESGCALHAHMPGDNGRLWQRRRGGRAPFQRALGAAGRDRQAPAQVGPPGSPGACASRQGHCAVGQRAASTRAAGAHA